MIIDIKFTSVVYRLSQAAEDERKVCHIYEENVTTARIVKEIPLGAIIESVSDISSKFEVDGDELLCFLLENGELK